MEEKQQDIANGNPGKADCKTLNSKDFKAELQLHLHEKCDQELVYLNMLRPQTLLKGFHVGVCLRLTR